MSNTSPIATAIQKPLEIYMFVDPLCPECWSLEPVIKKLKIRYGRFFTLRIIASASLTVLNKKRKKHLLAEAWEKIASRSGMSCDGNVWFEQDQPLSSPYMAALAFKAAELQGRKAGMQFLRNMQESLFVSKKNITDENVLLEIAEKRVSILKSSKMICILKARSRRFNVT